MRNAIVKSEPFTCFQLIEVPVTANSLSKVMCPDVPELRSLAGRRVVIKSIELITAKVLSKGPTNGYTTAALSELLKCSLVLYAEGWQKLNGIPLLRLNPMRDSDSTAATTIPFAPATPHFDSLGPVEWSKSYVQYSSGQSSSGANYTFIFGVNYVVLDDSSNPIKP